MTRVVIKSEPVALGAIIDACGQPLKWGQHEIEIPEDLRLSAGRVVEAKDGQRIAIGTPAHRSVIVFDYAVEDPDALVKAAGAVAGFIGAQVF